MWRMVSEVSVDTASATPLHDVRGQCQAVLGRGGKVRRQHWAEELIQDLNLSLKKRGFFPRTQIHRLNLQFLIIFLTLLECCRALC